MDHRGTLVPTTNNSLPARQRITTKAIQRAAWITLVALIAVLVSFAGYYVWDRYVHFGDRSPAELDIERMEETIHSDPWNPDARIALAASYLSAGQHADSLEQAEQVLELYPENNSALLISGICYVRMGQPEAAQRPLEKLVALRQGRPMAAADSTLEAAYYFLGEIHRQLGQPAEAISDLEAALLISPTDADALYQVGQAYQEIGAPDVALDRYYKAVRLVPDFVEAYAGMVEAYSALGQSTHETYAQGMVLFCLKDYRSAIAYLEQAAEALPDFVPVFLGLGLAYERLGELEAASSAVQRALELDPDDFSAHQALGRIEAALSQGK
jgi:tetratricopeptide (TPR) repeat protein